MDFVSNIVGKEIEGKLAFTIQSVNFTFTKKTLYITKTIE